MGAKLNTVKRILQFSIITVCLTGFLYQTIEFLSLYWTYPTVVDIQVSVPSEIQVPGITFCSSNGINPEVICSMGNFCLDARILKEANYCEDFPVMCVDKNVSSDFKAVTYNKFTTARDLNSSTMTMLRKPLTDFFSCKITSGKAERSCKTEDAVMGSYFSSANIFNFCFTINSLWSQPDKEILKIRKSEKIEMEFYVDISDGEKNIEDKTTLQMPKYSYPSAPSVQLVTHSPFLTASPFITGHEFLAGKDYKIKLKQEESHLLPPPYQTNCTNYMAEWLARRGEAPLNERMVVEECKFKNSMKEMKCVPFSIDYPHNETVCKYCKKCSNQQLVEKCTMLQQIYNQPCDFFTYTMDVEEKLIYFEQRVVAKSIGLDEKIVEKIKGHNCTSEKIWSKNCQTVRIELVFDDFEITNLTYNPKYESLELFSVIGGYMGMYLGVSIVAVYDFTEKISVALFKFIKNRRAKKDKTKKHVFRIQLEKNESTLLSRSGTSLRRRQ
ncbi:uncharacterized protein CDAR_5201 [Caerostris darwini]|uniref:Uncharacterized protein n=1 Tax=Caerostris darwini TaxID=1538125 RepID=A0AAV4P7W9_9ARAC|nr:uncharacterized protein CDAR_5201 [Caerostris darwini]